MSAVDQLTADGEPLTRLRAGAVGTAGVVFVVIAGAAPLTGLAGNVPLGIALGNGIGLPGAYVLVGVVLLLFSAGVRRVEPASGRRRRRSTPTSGSASAVAPAGSPPTWPPAATTPASPRSPRRSRSSPAPRCGPRSGPQVPWELLALGAIVLAGLLNLAGIAVSTKLLAVLMAMELAVVIAVDVAVLVDPGTRFPAVVFAPTEVFGPGLFVALLFAVLSFAGSRRPPVR